MRDIAALVAPPLEVCKHPEETYSTTFGLWKGVSNLLPKPGFDYFGQEIYMLCMHQAVNELNALLQSRYGTAPEDMELYNADGELDLSKVLDIASEIGDEHFTGDTQWLKAVSAHVLFGESLEYDPELICDFLYEAWLNKHRIAVKPLRAPSTDRPFVDVSFFYAQGLPTYVIDQLEAEAMRTVHALWEIIKLDHAL